MMVCIGGYQFWAADIEIGGSRRVRLTVLREIVLQRLQLAT